MRNTHEQHGPGTARLTVEQQYQQQHGAQQHSEVMPPMHDDREVAQPRSRRGRRIIAGVAVAAVSLGGGGFAASKYLSKNSAPDLAPPVAAAPANPGGEALPGPSVNAPLSPNTETTPNSQTGATGEVPSDPALWTGENYPFVEADGEVLVGTAAFEAKYGIEANGQSIREVAKELVARQDAWMNALNNDAASTYGPYQTYGSIDGQRGGTGAVAWDLATASFETALTATSDIAGATPPYDHLVPELRDWNQFAGINTAKAKSHGGTAYEAHMSIIGDDAGIFPSAAEDGEMAFSLRQQFVDNGDKTAVGKKTVSKYSYTYTMKETLGADGVTKYWKLVSALPTGEV